MLSMKSIRSKILGLVIFVGVILSMLLAFVAPRQARSLAQGVLQDNARLICQMLTDNLALGMQTVILDDGAAIKSTLETIRDEKQQLCAMISDVWVYDKSGNFITGLYEISSMIPEA